MRDGVDAVWSTWVVYVGKDTRDFVALGRGICLGSSGVDGGVGLY